MAFNYRTWAASWSNTWADTWGRADLSKGGIDERDYKRYRKYLEGLKRAADKEKIYPKRAIKAVEVLSELPVAAKEFKKIAAPPVTTGTLSLTPEIDYNVLLKEIALFDAYLDNMELLLENRREIDDEEAFLMILMQ